MVNVQYALVASGSHGHVRCRQAEYVVTHAPDESVHAAGRRVTQAGDGPIGYAGVAGVLAKREHERQQHVDQNFTGAFRANEALRRAAQRDPEVTTRGPIA